MSRYKHLIPRLTMALAMSAAFAAGGWSLSDQRRQSRGAVSALQKSTEEYAALVREMPGSPDENERATLDKLAAAGQALAAWRKVVHPRDDQIDSGPAGPTEAYFEIAAYGARIRALAVTGRVAVKPGEHFGFSAHVSSGPEAELVPAVLRQRRDLQDLLEALIDARPVALLRVQRQRPAAKPRGNQAAPAGPEPSNDDYFDFAGSRALAVPPHWRSQAYRLEFSGRTGVLRGFLNRISADQALFVVRSVEVAPLPAEASGADHGRPNSASGSGLLVGQNLSRFTVVVEAVDPATEPAEPTDPAS